ncbi:MAG: LacI family DNA-binding transcriptional regulator [Shimia sp.]
MNLKELSALLELSQTTVSRALNGYPEVSEDTRKRVRDAAERHNYRPNTRAKGLATGRAMAIGHVIPMSSRNEMVNPIFGDFIAGAGEAYAKRGYDILLSLVEDGDEARVYREFAAKASVDGVILHAPRTTDSRIDLLRSLNLPFLIHGRVSSEGQPYSFVDVANVAAFREGTEALIGLGHRRIALLNGEETFDFAARRRKGYEGALSAAGIAADPDMIFAGEMTEAIGFATARDLLARPEPPTAFLVSSMISAIGVRRAIHKAGLKIGRDISVLCFDDALSYLDNGEGEAIFTAMRSSVREAGRLAAGHLIDRIEDPTLPHTRHVLEAELILGASTGPAKDS